jgi:hypothetical protein
MNWRPIPQSKIDDAAFPVRVMILVPERGFERALDALRQWLDREVGRGDYAHHGSGRRLPDASAFYFRTAEEAQRFIAAFPNLVLDDRTTCLSYRSPQFPFGRRWYKPAAPRARRSRRANPAR